MAWRKQKYNKKSWSDFLKEIKEFNCTESIIISDTTIREILSTISQPKNTSNTKNNSLQSSVCGCWRICKRFMFGNQSTALNGICG